MRIALVLLALPLAGCIFMKEVPLPDGSRGYAISNCRDSAACMKKAAEVCGGKYEIIESGSTTVGTIVGGVGTFSSPHDMTFRCPQ